MTLYLIRHGETPYNEKGLLQGRTDNPLNPSGLLLAKWTGEAFKREGIVFEKAISSPLIRARQTTAAILESAGQKDLPVELDERVIEMSIGTWEGKSAYIGQSDIDPEQMRLFHTNPFLMDPIEKGETAREVCARTKSFLDDLAANPVSGNVLVSSHGFAVRAMLNPLYDDPTDFWQGSVPLNCSVNILSFRDGKWEFVEKDKIYYDPKYAVDRYSSPSENT